MNQRGKKKKRIKRIEDNLRDLQDNVKCPNIRIIGVPEEDRKKDHKKILEEIIVENLPKMGKEIITQGQETQRVPNRKTQEKHPKTHINQINKDQTQRTNIKNKKKETKEGGTEFRPGKGILKREKFPNIRKPSHCRICAELWKHRGQHNREKK